MGGGVLGGNEEKEGETGKNLGGEGEKSSHLIAGKSFIRSTSFPPRVPIISHKLLLKSSPFTLSPN